jgi:hypothetical protein
MLAGLLIDISQNRQTEVLSSSSSGKDKKATRLFHNFSIEKQQQMFLPESSTSLSSVEEFLSSPGWLFSGTSFF